jgi:hypothetical protein
MALDRRMPDRWYRLLIDWIAGHLYWPEFLRQVKEIFPEAAENMYYGEIDHADRIYEATLALEQEVGEAHEKFMVSPRVDFRTQVKIWWGEFDHEWYRAANEGLPDDYWSQGPLDSYSSGEAPP